jgi:hypothetical protein
MDIIQMHQAVMQGVDKVHAQTADTLLSAEIDLELNKAIQQFVTTRFQQNNKYREGFEESQKRRDDLRALVVETTIPVIFKEVLNDYNSDYPVFIDTCSLPSDYMFQVNVQADLWRSKRCVGLPYITQATEEKFYFLIDKVAGIQNNLDGLSTEYISYYNIANVEPSADDYNTDVNGDPVLWQNFWEWGYSWNGTSSAFTSQNDITVYPSNFNQVLGDILTYGMNGLIGNGITGLNPNPGEYQDNIGPDWEDLTSQNIVAPNSIIIPWTQMMNETDNLGNTLYSADLSNGWLSYIMGFSANGAILYKSPLMKLEETSSKRYPSTYNSDNDSWTNAGILKEVHAVKVVQFDDVYVMTKDPFNKTKYSSPLATMRGEHIDLYTDETFIIDKVRLTYIREPQIVESPATDCDLPIHTHEEIVKMAVSSILEGISDPRYQTHQIEVGKME